MISSRLYVDGPLQTGMLVELPTDAAHHALRVLRLRSGDVVRLFNGRGGEYTGRVEHRGGGAAAVRLETYDDVDRESPLTLTLAQGISRGERMDFTVQKAVELGVTRIVPLLTERTTVQLDEERAAKRIEHWRKVAIGACEQSGRTSVPDVGPVLSFEVWLEHQETDCRLLLRGVASAPLSAVDPQGRPLTLLVGPEGGLSEAEVALAVDAGYQPVRLGPRTLRTETAALVALAILQSRFGDLAATPSAES